jgi:putative ABC transport system permease protein
MRYALRSLIRAPGFSLAAVAILAIGIGANAAMFSVVDAALLRPLPFREAENLYVLGRTNPKRAIAAGPFAYPAYVEMASRQRSLEGLAAFAYDRFNATGSERPEQLPGARVSWTFFNVLGVDRIVGRGFERDDDLRGGPLVAIISRRLWTRMFNAAPDAIGASLTLNGSPFSIVGALPLDLPPPFDSVDVWTTRVDELSGFTRPLIEAGLGYLTAVARVSGARLEQARAELDTIVRGYARAHPTNSDADPEATMQFAPIRDAAVGTARPPLAILMGAVGLVLLIACANVSNLLLVRATARSHEVAVRAALGASRIDIIRWLASESILLAAAGGIGGVLLAFWAVDFASSALNGVPRASEVAVNGRALLFSCGVCALAAVAFGIGPSSFALRQSPIDALRSGSRTTASGRGPHRLLVIFEVALSLVLLVGAGLLLQSFRRLTHVPVGFNPSGLLTVRVSLPTSRYPDAAAMRAFMTRTIDTLQAAPGIASASATMALPPAITTMAPYQAGDRPTVGIGERPVGQWCAITPGYFRTLGISLVAGRLITDRDTESSPLVVVISRELAARTWPNDSPIGKKLLVGRFPDFAEVVGVVGDVKNNGLGRDPMVVMYTPYRQRPWPAMQFAIRAASGDPASVATAVTAAFRAVDRDLPLTGVEPMEQTLSDSIATERLIAALVAAFATVALMLSAAGLYAVIAYTVERRTTEIGIRIALGAGPRAVVRLVAAEGLLLAGVGMIVGTALAIVGARVLRTILFGVSPGDPITYAGVLLLFTATALAALVVPTRRALGVDPILALRAD